MSTLKELAQSANLVAQEALERALTELKNYIDNKDAANKSQLQSQIDALVGAAGGDADKLLNTFNDIKAFLADYDEDDTLKTLLDAVQSSIATERERAVGVEQALSTRIKTLEDVSVMSSQQAKDLFDSVFAEDSSSSE